jgi:2-oxoglutarate ferredoxin oxidoreductase subunit gamma
MERNLMVAGFGGQGILLLGKLLANTASDYTDKNVTFFPSYGAEMRGGTASCYVVISDEMIGAPLGDAMDDLIVMNQPSFDKYLFKLLPGGTLFINSSIVEAKTGRDDLTVISAPVTELALELGNPRVLNIAMLGVYVGYTDILPAEAVMKSITELLSKRADMLPVNTSAFERGLDIGRAARK